MTEYVTPNIHTVLKKYQTSAPKSLQGPGHSLVNIANAANASASATASVSAVAAAAAAASSALAVAASGNCPLDATLNNGVANLSSSELHGLVGSMRHSSPCDLNKTASNTAPVATAAAASAAPSASSSLAGGLCLSAGRQQQSPPILPASMSSSNPALPLIKKEIMTSPEPAPMAHDLQVEQQQLPPQALNTSPLGPPPPPPPVSQSVTSSLPPSIKIMPPPPPEVSQPILSSADTGSAELYETKLEGKTIGCFSMGGEMRLCLPQFLNNVLAEFSLEQINRSFDDLGIYCSQCTADQLQEFKAAKILPTDVKSSGLITRTDAERLCAVLLHRSDRNSYINVEDIPKGAISFKVFHHCFGKCEGICTPDMYSYQKPTCIMCLECKGWFSPQKFVGHVHRKVENRTCHWGFDSRNWHEYLRVALDVENREKYQKILDELKEVEFKEQQKALEINYLKRKAELHLDHSLLVPSMGLPPPQPPPHQPLPPSVLKHRGEQLDIPSTKKTKSLDDATAAAAGYPAEYQYYHSLVYAHCAHQQRMASAGQMSAFRPWPQPKSFIHAAYNALSTLPYLSQEPPVLQNPERVVRSSDRERFERTYQPNVALAPRKTHLAQEREKEQRELRERDRMEREREREMERMRELERERSRERERKREYEREWDRECEQLLHKQQLKHQLKQQQQHQQPHQQQQQQAPQQLRQQPVPPAAADAAEIQIKQERAPTPIEESSTTPPPLDNRSEDADRRGSNVIAGSSIEEEATTPMTSPLALSRSSAVKLLGNMDAQSRRQSLQHSSSSNSSASSTTTPTNLASTPPAQKLQHPVAPQSMQRLGGALPAAGGMPPSSTQGYMRQSPSPGRRCGSATCTNNPCSPQEFGGSNEITSSTSPLPQPHANAAQTIIATVNHHSKLLPSSSSSATYGANGGHSHNHNSSNNSSSSNNNNNNELPGRIRISKNLINQNNIIRSPSPPPPPPHAQPQPQQQQHHHHHQQYQHQHQHPHQHHHYKSHQVPGSLATTAQNHDPHLHRQQQQQHCDFYKQSQQRFYQPHHLPPGQQHTLQRAGRNTSPQAPQNRNSPSQSSTAGERTAGLNLSTHGAASDGKLGPSLDPSGQIGCLKQPHLRVSGPLGQQPHARYQHHLHASYPPSGQLANGRMAAPKSCEFELSTDTDEESVHDGEPDSSNSLTPTELAMEALRDAPPKERERVLSMLQRILKENQHYRLQNQQQKELIELRNEQIANLQAELQHYQRQLGMLQISQQQQQAPSHTAGLNGNGSSAAGGNGLITKALRKETNDHQLMLRLPLKKQDNTKEEQEANIVEKCFQPLKEIKRELSESMDMEDDMDCDRSMAAADDNSQPNVGSSHHEERTRSEAHSDSESDRDEEDGHLDRQRYAGDKDNNAGAASEGDSDSKMSSSDKGSAKRSQSSESDRHSKRSRLQAKDSVDSDESDARSTKGADGNEMHEDESQESQAADEDDEQDEEEEEEEQRVQAPHSNAAKTPPTATTPLSPDSAATAGQLFDSSNSSDGSANKKAQIPAVRTVVKQNSESRDDQEEDEEEEVEEEDEEEENENDDERRRSDDEEEEEETRQTKPIRSHRRMEVDSSEDEEEHDMDNGDEDEDYKPPAPQRHFRLDAASKTPPGNAGLTSGLATRNSSTTTVVLATKASKKQTPTTNSELKIKQEYL